MKRICDQIQSRIPLAAQGELDESARAEILDHASGCPSCQGALEFQTRLHGAMIEDPMAAPPPVYFEGVLEEIHRRMPARPQQYLPARRRFQPQTLATALVAALALLWVGAGLDSAMTGHLFTTASKPGQSRLSSATLAATENLTAGTLRVVKGYGICRADAEWLSYSPELRQEMGLPIEDPRTRIPQTIKG